MHVSAVLVGLPGIPQQPRPHNMRRRSVGPERMGATYNNVNGIWTAVRSAYQKRVISANADELRNHQAASAEQLHKATNVLATQ